MRIMLGLMVVAFASVGLMLIVGFTRELVQRIGASHRLLRTQGVIVDVFRKQSHRGPKQYRYRPSFLFLPVISFTPEGGSPIRFRSEIGDAGEQSRYRIGESIGVRYDPLGVIPPMLDGWSGLWLPPLLGIFGGLVFVAASVLTTWILIRHESVSPGVSTTDADSRAADAPRSDRDGKANGFPSDVERA